MKKYIALYLPYGGEIIVGDIVLTTLLSTGTQYFKIIEKIEDIDISTQIKCKLHLCSNIIGDGDVIFKQSNVNDTVTVKNINGEWYITEQVPDLLFIQDSTGKIIYEELITGKWFKSLCIIPDYITRFIDGDEISSDIINMHDGNTFTFELSAPFTDDEIKRLNEYQHLGFVHPYTCGNDHKNDEDDILVATHTGWICPSCEYKQKWVSSLILDTEHFKESNYIWWQ